MEELEALVSFGSKGKCILFFQRIGGIILKFGITHLQIIDEKF
jgi:hypothetical protein